MGRGPKIERIDGADATFRVVIDGGVHQMTVPDCELLARHEAVRIARAIRTASAGPIRLLVVNERTGFTADEFTRS